MQYETSELPASDGCTHGLPRWLKLPMIARRNDLCEEGPPPGSVIQTHEKKEILAREWFIA